MSLIDADMESEIVRMLSGALSPEEEARFRSKCSTNPQLGDAFQALKEAWEKMPSLETAYRISESSDGEWERFRQKHFHSRPQGNSLLIRSLQRIAAVLLPLMILAGLGYYYLGSSRGIGWSGVVAASVDSLYLEDSSMVVLNANTEIRYNISETKRLVQLNGIAYFQVARDKKRPFIVKLNKSEVKVLGTAFVIENIKGRDRVVVEVTDGHVEFGNDNQKVVMTRGERGILENGRISVEQYDSESANTWIGGLIVLRSATIDEVCSQLMRFYPQIKKIRKDIGRDDTVRVTTSFDHQSLDEVVSELSIHFGKKIEFDGGYLDISD